jgi:hypothetical protein
VAARSVAISSPGPKGCTGGFGAGPFTGSGSGTPAGGSAGATA